MSDKFSPAALPQLLRICLSAVRERRFMNIPGSLFFKPRKDDPFRIMRYGRVLETPLGVAAGPHTQLALNIVAAWLCGARYIELKTVQVLDELEVTKPCIDMHDEGYNCEWSQELKTEQSFNEYLNAWILIHILHKELGFAGRPGMIFNMSVGYNLEGILSDKVQRFLAMMENCAEALDGAKRMIRPVYPAIDKLGIPSIISDSVTLSTMHGCPPDEIGKIGRYLLGEKGFHTTIKLNPTLLGADELRNILNKKLSFQAEVPDEAFDHDLKYPDAVTIIRELTGLSKKSGKSFSLKLSNTLETTNATGRFSETEKMVYLSGRALHPITIDLARKLQNDFEGKLDISFSGGADCFNILDILSCGLKPVTVSSDLLKPGGYGRLSQYVEILRRDPVVIEPSSGEALQRLNEYAGKVVDDPSYRNAGFTPPDAKTSRPLGLFDCIHAPCTDTCPANQDVPGYLSKVAAGNPAGAFETIFLTNPFPSVTGLVCDHPCQLKCTRVNYDESLKIREVKRFAAMTPPPTPPLKGEGSRRGAGAGGGVPASDSPPKLAIIGAGPAGLSCAWFLRLAGCEVDIFESKKTPGGMVSAAIPAFRLPEEEIRKDIERILFSGINLIRDHTIGKEEFIRLQKEYDAIFLAAGAQESILLKIGGIEAAGVLDPLTFLFDARQERKLTIGKKIVVIGGGNTAMDAARSALRMSGPGCHVTILYRRTIREMPADKGEIRAAMDEGIRIMELTNPEGVISDERGVTGLTCSRNILALKGDDGRPLPVKVPGSEFEIACDTIIPAIGQRLAIDFSDAASLQPSKGSYKTSTEKLYIGGDALHGAGTAIQAIGDGRKAALEILADLGFSSVSVVNPEPENILFDELMHQRSVRIRPADTPSDSSSDPFTFNHEPSDLTPEEAAAEASRCLRCDLLCNICVTACPNLANFSYPVKPTVYRLQKAVVHANGGITFEEDCEFSVSQPFQVLNIRDLCNECGNCTTFCPSSGRPFADKAGLCLSVETLNREGEGFLLSRLPGRDILIYKKGEFIKTLTETDGTLTYETDQIRAVINPDDLSLKDVRFLTPCLSEAGIRFAAEMKVIMEGARQIAR